MLCCISKCCFPTKNVQWRLFAFTNQWSHQTWCCLNVLFEIGWTLSPRSKLTIATTAGSKPWNTVIREFCTHYKCNLVKLNLIWHWHTVACTKAEGQPPTFVGHWGEMSTFVSHSGEMSHSPAPFTSNQTPFGGIDEPAHPPFNVHWCTLHATVDITCLRTPNKTATCIRLQL